jgi:hypothetical protein
LMVLTLFVAYLHESGTGRYIIDFLAVPPP